MATKKVNFRKNVNEITNAYVRQILDGLAAFHFGTREWWDIEEWKDAYECTYDLDDFWVEDSGFIVSYYGGCTSDETFTCEEMKEILNRYGYRMNGRNVKQYLTERVRYYLDDMKPEQTSEGTSEKIAV